MNNNLKELIFNLEQAYVGAKALNDTESMCRISRAIVMLETPSDIEVAVPDGYWESYIHKIVSETI